jgi:hypothetical protein
MRLVKVPNEEVDDIKSKSRSGNGNSENMIPLANLRQKLAKKDEGGRAGEKEG